MKSVETLLGEYIEEHRAGGAADPVEFLERAAPGDRRELAALIDAYLARAPRASMADRAQEDPRAEATIEALSRSIGGSAGTWPALLPRLRDRAGLKRRELVAALASALGVSARAEKVERYYHEMELGVLPAGGVSDRVLEALAGLVGTTAAELREAGDALGEGITGGAGLPVFARTAMFSDAAPEAAVDRAQAPEERDEVDELFLGEG